MVSVSGDVSMKNVIINGQKIDYLQIQKGSVVGARMSPHIKVETHHEVFYLLEGTDINILSLAKNSIEEMHSIIQQFEEII